MPAPFPITPRWKSPILGGRRAFLEFDVYAASQLAARATVPFQVGSTHPEDASLVMVDPPEVTGAPPGMMLVRCEFVRPDFGTNPTDPNNPGNPLLAAPRILWGRSSLSEPTDVARGRVHIRNAAGTTLTPKLTRTIFGRTLSITKYFDLYPYDIAERFEDTVNHDSVSVSGVSFPAESMRCLSITAPEYPSDANMIAATVNIEIRTSSSYPHRTPSVNQGREGWYSTTTAATTGNGTVTVSKLGALTVADGAGTYHPVNDDQLLDASGIPLLPSVKVENGQTPVANPNSVAGWIPAPDAPGPAIIMLWELFRDYEDFTQLLAIWGIQ